MTSLVFWRAAFRDFYLSDGLVLGLLERIISQKLKQREAWSGVQANGKLFILAPIIYSVRPRYWFAVSGFYGSVGLLFYRYQSLKLISLVTGKYRLCSALGLLASIIAFFLGFCPWSSQIVSRLWKHLCVLIHIWIKGEVFCAVKPV